MSAHFLCAAVFLMGQAGSGYPRAELLIEATELSKPEVIKRFHVLDVRGKDKYLAAHIPGAIWLDTAEWTKAFAQGQDAAAWSRRLGQVYIGDVAAPVAVCGDDVREAARVWWILRYWGLRDVRIVNGGWQAWTLQKLRAEKGPVGARPVLPTLAAQQDRLATKEQLLKDQKDKRFALFDVRSEGEFCGDTKLAKRGGAIPEARHLEWTEVIDQKTQRFKGPAELAKLLKEAGVDPARPTVTYCQSGGRASVMAFALELMGAKEVRNYYQSWAEWGNSDDTPIVTPKK